MQLRPSRRRRVRRSAVTSFDTNKWSKCFQSLNSKRQKNVPLFFFLPAILSPCFILLLTNERTCFRIESMKNMWSTKIAFIGSFKKTPKLIKTSAQRMLNKSCFPTSYVYRMSLYFISHMLSLLKNNSVDSFLAFAFRSLLQ